MPDLWPASTIAPLMTSISVRREPGCLHVDTEYLLQKYLPQTADAQKRRYLFVAIDRATRGFFVRIHPAQDRFQRAPLPARPGARGADVDHPRAHRQWRGVHRRAVGPRRRAATGNHDVDRLRADLDIEHRLAPPMRPQTNGMVERFNVRIKDVLQSHRFRSGKDLEQRILRYLRLCSAQLPQSVLNGRTPINAMTDRHHRRPELFHERRYNHPGWDKP